jgi:hypothetical protein
MQSVLQEDVMSSSTNRTNPLALVSLVAGILWLYWIGSAIAVVTGLIAFRQVDRSGGTESGRGIAIAGMSLGLVGLSIYLTLILAANS